MAPLVAKLLFAAGVACSKGQEHPPNYRMMFNQFKEQYDKFYNGEDEEDKRFAIFKANVDFIYASNAQDTTFELGVNQFTDLTQQEFSAGYTGYKRRGEAAAFKDAPFLGNHTYGGEELPDTVDWTTQGAVTPIKDQGQCGSCWSFSTTGALEGAWKIATGKLVSLSEQEFVDCAHPLFPPLMGCHGGNMGTAFNWIKGRDLCTEDSYPYKARGGSCMPASSCTIGIPKGGVVGWKGLAPVGRIIPTSEQAMQSAVAQQPVSVAIEADHPVFQSYKSGVITANCGEQPDHGVLVVGYGTDEKYGKYWKLKNSWGVRWGEQGFLRIARGMGGHGECSILGSPSYPIVSASGNDGEAIVV